MSELLKTAFRSFHTTSVADGSTIRITTPSVSEVSTTVRLADASTIRITTPSVAKVSTVTR